MLKVLENLKLLGKLVFEIKVNCLSCNKRNLCVRFCSLKSKIDGTIGQIEFFNFLFNLVVSILK